MGSGAIMGGHVNSPLWGSPDAKRPASDVHAEVNAIGHCARRGQQTEGATIYITMPPCKRCFTVLVAAGVKRIVTRKGYNPQDFKEIDRVARRVGIALPIIEDTENRRAHIDSLAGKRKHLASDDNEEKASVEQPS